MLQWQKCFEEGGNVQVHKEYLDVLVDLKGKIASSSNESLSLSRPLWKTALASSETLTISLMIQIVAMKPSNIGTHSSTSYSKLKTLFMLTEMEIGHCICR